MANESQLQRHPNYPQRVSSLARKAVGEKPKSTALSREQEWLRTKLNMDLLPQEAGHQLRRRTIPTSQALLNPSANLIPPKSPPVAKSKTKTQNANWSARFRK